MKELIEIAFPGIGIEPFTLNKIAFSIGKIEVRWYGILITCGIILAFLYASWRGRRNERVVLDDVIDIALFTVPLGVVGARLYYVLTTLDEYRYESLLDVIAVWNGGLAIYGGIIGGCIGILLACKLKKIRWQKVFDMIAPGVMIAQALGRWGNFFNGEAYGYEIAETTRFYFFNTEHVLNSGEGTLFHFMRMGLSHVPGTYLTYYHPTFLYESLWNILGFVLINLFYKRKKFDGQIALMYFTWYGFGRMFVEGLRTDSLYIPGTTLRISQCVGLLCFLGGLLLIVGLLLLQRKRPDLVICESVQVASDTGENASEAISEEILTENADASETDDEAEKTEESEEEEHGKAD